MRATAHRQNQGVCVCVFVCVCVSVCVCVWTHRGPLSQFEYNRKLCVHNICSDAVSQGCDAHFVKDVMEHHLSGPDLSNSCSLSLTPFIHLSPSITGRSRVGEELIRKQKAAAARSGISFEIVQSGDHGPHFSSKETFFNQTLFFQDYGVILTDCFLCSYHAFNVCDAAGNVSKTLASAALRDGKVRSITLTRMHNTHTIHPHTHTHTHTHTPTLYNTSGIAGTCGGV